MYLSLTRVSTAQFRDKDRGWRGVRRLRVPPSPWVGGGKVKLVWVRSMVVDIVNNRLWVDMYGRPEWTRYIALKAISNKVPTLVASERCSTCRPTNLHKHIQAVACSLCFLSFHQRHRQVVETKDQLDRYNVGLACVVEQRVTSLSETEWPDYGGGGGW